MTRRYVITTPANIDLEDILRRVSDLSGFDKSDRFLTRFSDKLKNIVSFPNLGKPRPEWGNNYRSIIAIPSLVRYELNRGLNLVQ